MGSFSVRSKKQIAYLCLTDVLHGKIEPDSETRVACVWPDEEVKLELTDVVDAAQVSCQNSPKHLALALIAVCVCAFASVPTCACVCTDGRLPGKQSQWIISSLAAGESSNREAKTNSEALIDRCKSQVSANGSLTVTLLSGLRTQETTRAVSMGRAHTHTHTEGLTSRLCLTQTTQSTSKRSARSVEV